MKRTHIRTTALLLVLMLTIGACTASAETSKTPMDGYDPKTNWTGTFRGIQFSLPNYYDVAQEDGKTVYLYVPELSGNGTSPAWLFFDVLDRQYASNAFSEQANAILDRMCTGVDGTILNRQESCKIAGYPATGMRYSFSDSDGSWESMLYLIYNENTREIMNVQLIQSVDSRFSFISDYVEILNHAQPIASGATVTPAPTAAPQVSSSVKTLCDNYVDSINRTRQLMQQYDVDDIGLIDSIIIAAEIYDIIDCIDRFENASKTGWSSTDLEYYAQARNTFSQNIAQEVIQWINNATRGMFS